MRAPASAITNAVFGTGSINPPDSNVSGSYFNASGRARIARWLVWKEQNLNDERDYVELRRYSGGKLWTMVREKCDEDRALLDSACTAAMAGPILLIWTQRRVSR